jgi:hypothetical protein
MSRRKKYSPAELERRRSLMRRLNASGRCGPQFGRLGGRPRAGESRSDARERRRRELADLETQVQPRKQVAVKLKPEHTIKVETESAQAGRALREHRPQQTRYRTGDRPGLFYL